MRRERAHERKNINSPVEGEVEREKGRERERAKESELKRARNSRGSVIERDKLWELN